MISFRTAKTEIFSNRNLSLFNPHSHFAKFITKSESLKYETRYFARMTGRGRECRKAVWKQKTGKTRSCVAKPLEQNCSQGSRKGVTSGKGLQRSHSENHYSHQNRKNKKIARILKHREKNIRVTVIHIRYLFFGKSEKTVKRQIWRSCFPEEQGSRGNFVFQFRDDHYVVVRAAISRSKKENSTA